MYGISNASQLATLFGTGEPSFSVQSAVNVPAVSTGTAMYGVNTANPTSEDTALLSIKANATAFKESLTALTAGIHNDSSKLNQMRADSSDNSVASAELLNGRAPRGDIELSVSQLASGHEYSTNNMRAGELNFEVGTQTLSVGQGRSVSIEVNRDDTNEIVLRKMADAFNRQGMGISAEVSDNGGLVSLTIASNGVGSSAAFELEDSRGSFIGVSGLSVTEQAQDAKYTVNGASRTSGSNDIEINGRVAVSLRDTGDAVISFSRDLGESANAVKEFMASYNELLGSNEKVAGQLSNTSSTYGKSLADAGFTFDDDGKISISDKDLENSLSNGTMRSLFSGGDNYGYPSRLAQIARTVERAPQLYAAQANTYTSYNAERLNTQQNQVSFMLGLFYNSII